MTREEIEEIKKRLNAALLSEDFMSTTVLESLNDIGLLIETIADQDRRIENLMGYITEVRRTGSTHTKT